MQVVSKRSLAADLAKRPAPAAPSTRGDARIMAMFIGEPSQPHLLAGGGLYSAYGTAPGGRKKMKLVSNNDDDGEDQNNPPPQPTQSVDFLAASSVTPAEAAALEKKRKQDIIEGDTLPDDMFLMGPWFLRQVKKNTCDSDYQTVSSAFRRFKTTNSQDFSELLDTMVDVLLKKNKLPYLYENVHWFIPRAVRNEYVEQATSRQHLLEQAVDGDQDLFEHD
jgi:hypothetical protein